MNEKSELLEKTECKRQHFPGANYLHSVSTHKVQTAALSRCNSIAPNTLKCIQSTRAHVLPHTRVLKDEENSLRSPARHTSDIEHVSAIIPRAIRQVCAPWPGDSCGLTPLEWLCGPGCG